MLEKVRNFWIKGVLDQSMYSVARLELGMTTKPDAVEDDWNDLVQRPGQPQQQLPPGTRISTIFDEFGKALLILGAPGAGKTMLLLELTQDLLDRAEKDSNHPLPVVFNLSTWAVRQPPLTAWLVDELCERYQVPRKHAQSWVDKELIVPLLDGLDEVAPECRSSCAEAINAFRTEHGLVPLAVCSRVADYEVLTTKLNLQGALVVHPPTREQTTHYLAQAGAPLAGVRAALQDDETLWELLDTPLMLNVATLAYPGYSAAEVTITGTLEERKKQLFTAYVDAMFKRRGKALLYPRQQTIQWLAWLASAMTRHNQTVFYLEWMQPNWLSSKWQQMIVKLGVIVLSWLSGALFMMFYPLLYDLHSDLDLKLAEDLIFGLNYGLVFGLFGLGNVLWTRNLGIHPVETVRWMWSATKKHWISRMLSFGLVGGLVGWLISWAVGQLTGMNSLYESLGMPVQPRQPGYVSGVRWAKWSVGELFYEMFGWRFRDDGLFDWQIAPLLNGLFSGLFSGLVGLWSGGLVMSEIASRVIANEGIRRSLRNAFRFGLFGGIVGWLFGGLVVGLTNWLFGGERDESWYGEPFFGLFFGIVFGLFFGLRNGGFACFQHLTLRFLLWCNGFAPWRYVRFLDFAAERVFLRKVGGGYIFVHRMLLGYFAAQHH